MRRLYPLLLPLLLLLQASPSLQQDTVAMVIAGNDQTEGTRRLSEVELFGCPGAEDRGIPVSPLPTAGYGMAAVLTLDSEAAMHEALVCGGFQCEAGVPFCLTRRDCFRLASGVIACRLLY